MNCVTQPALRLDEERLTTVVNRPLASAAAPIEIRQEEFVKALTEVALQVPLPVAAPSHRSGREIFVSWAESRGGSRQEFLIPCASSEVPDGCLRLPHKAPAIETLTRLRLALSASMDTVWDGATIPISEFLNPHTFKVMVYTALSTYLVTLLLPDPFTKGLAAVLTVWLVAYLGLGPVWAMMKAGWALLEDVQHAASSEELQQAGRRYGRVLGDNGMRVLLLLATAAVSGQTSFLAKGPRLPGFRQAAAASMARTGVRLEASGAVETVALGEQGLAVGLTPPAVAAMSMGPGGGPATTRVGRWMSEAEYDAMLESGRVQAPSNGAGSTHVTIPPNATAFKPPPQSTRFVEFDVPTEQLRIHDPTKGWGRVFGPGSLEARAAQIKGLPVPTAMPQATNIRVIIP